MATESIFQQRAAKQQQDIKKPNGSAFQQRQEELGIPPEPWYKDLARTIAQPVQGFLEGTVPGMVAGAFQLLSAGEMLDEEGIEGLERAAKQQGVPFDREQYLEAAHKILGGIPTVSNLASQIEEKTGIPLEPKTKLQKTLRLGSLAAKAVPGTIGQKTVAGVAAPATKEVLEELGVPEGLAEFAGLGVAGLAGAKAPKIDIAKSKKLSGLTERRYEKLKAPKEVSSKKIHQINEKVETEFRDIASKIIEKSPIEDTYAALKDDVGFKAQSQEAFKEVEFLAEEIPEVFSTKQVKEELVNQAFKKNEKGFTPSEFEKAHQKIVNEFLKETPLKDATAKDLVNQYRKNNKALSEAYEPGQSFAYNRAKREAYQDYNKAIANLIESKFPESEFSNLFKSTNKKWSQIMDAEAIDKFVDRMFDGKIRFEKGKDFFNKEGMKIPFKRALGEEGFKEFEQLMKDLMSTEQANKMMIVAKKKGYQDLGEKAMAYVIHPKLGLAKTGYSAAKTGYKKIVEALLDKPKLVFTWDEGVKAFKKGDFAKAEKEFDILEKSLAEKEASEISRKDALKKFNEKINP
jgi:hypothetical protein